MAGVYQLVTRISTNDLHLVLNEEVAGPVGLLLKCVAAILDGESGKLGDDLKRRRLWCTLETRSSIETRLLKIFP